MFKAKRITFAITSAVMSLTMFAGSASAATPIQTIRRVSMTQRDLPAGFRMDGAGSLPSYETPLSDFCNIIRKTSKTTRAREFSLAIERGSIYTYVLHEVGVYSTPAEAAAVLTHVRTSVPRCKLGVYFPYQRFKINSISVRSNALLPIKDNLVMRMNVTSPNQPTIKTDTYFIVQRSGSTVNMVLVTRNSGVNSTRLAAAMRIATLTGRRQLLP